MDLRCEIQCQHNSSKTQLRGIASASLPLKCAIKGAPKKETTFWTTLGKQHYNEAEWNGLEALLGIERVVGAVDRVFGVGIAAFRLKQHQAWHGCFAISETSNFQPEVGPLGVHGYKSRKKTKESQAFYRPWMKFLKKRIGLTYIVHIFFHVAWHSSLDCWIRKSSSIVRGIWWVSCKQQANCFDTRCGSRACGMSFKGRSAMNFLTWCNQIGFPLSVCCRCTMCTAGWNTKSKMCVSSCQKKICNHFQHSALPQHALTQH